MSVSEALATFRLQHRFNTEKITDEMMEEIRHLGNLNVPGLLPNFPSAWRESEKFLSSKEFSHDRLCFEEVIIDFLMRSVQVDAFGRLIGVVKDHLARVFQGVYQSSWYGYWQLKNAKSVGDFFRVLQAYSPEFKSQEIVTREDQEIFAVRCTIFAILIKPGRVESLRLRAESLHPPSRSMQAEVTEILDFIISLGKAEYYLCLKYQQGLEELLAQLEFAKKEGGKRRFQPPVMTSLVPTQTEALQKKEKGTIKIDPTALIAKDSEIAKIQEEWSRYGKTFSVKEGAKQKLLDKMTSAFRSLSNVFSRDGFTKLVGIVGLVDNIIPMGLSFFQGGLDASSRRYRSIMKGLRELEKGQQMILQNQFIVHEQLLEIDQKIVVIAKNQIEIGKAIVGIAHLVETQHRETMLALALIQHDVVINRMVLSSMLDRSGKMCREARSELMRFRGYLPYYNRFNTYRKCLEFYRRERFYLVEGLRGLLGLLMRPGENDAALVIPFERSETEVLFFEHYRDLWKVVQEYTSREGFKTFEYLLETQTDAKQLDAHMKAYQEIERVEVPEWIEERLRWVDLDTLVRSPYDIGRLLDYCESARCFHYFYELFKDEIGGPLVSSENLSTHDPSPYGERLIQDTLIRIQVGILQLNLLSGFGIIPFLYQKMEEKKLESLSSLLGANKMLAKNFMIYVFRKRMEEKRRVYSDYWYPYCMANNPEPLKALVGKEWNFVWDKEREKWVVPFLAEIEPIEVPHPVDLINGTLEVHPQLGDLHMMRKKLLRELAGYQPVNHSENEIGKVWEMGVVLNSMYFRNALTVQEEENRSKL